MQLRRFLYFLMICIAVGIYADARTPAKNTRHFKLLEAFSQRTLPGRKEVLPISGTHFIIIWESAKSPETFSWRGDNGWLSCNVGKAHKVDDSHAYMPRNIGYSTEPITIDQIHKGDTIELSAVTGGKFPIPDEIPENVKNTLYYKTGGSGWLSFPVQNISKKPDIRMP